MVDLAWTLVRMTPVKLFEVDLSPTENKKFEGGVASMHIIRCVPVQTNVGHCLMITALQYMSALCSVYTVMKNAQSMMVLLRGNASVITFDIAVHVKANEIKWRLRQ